MRNAKATAYNLLIDAQFRKNITCMLWKGLCAYEHLEFVQFRESYIRSVNV